MSLKPFVLVLLQPAFQSGSPAKFTQIACNSDLDSAEHLFISGNFILLAQKYNIQVQKALEIQAKLYPNPNFSILLQFI